MLTQAVALILLSQVPSWSSSHLQTQKYKWEQTQKLDKVRIEFTLKMSTGEDTTSQVWKIWKSGPSSNLEVLIDGKIAVQFSTNGSKSYMADFANKMYYEIPVTEPGESKFTMPEIEEDQIDFKFESLWFYVNSSRSLEVTKAAEEKVDGRDLVVIDYKASKEDSTAELTEWIDPRTGLVHRFAMRGRSKEHGFQAIDGWISQLDMKDATNMATILFDPAAHSDFTKGN